MYNIMTDGMLRELTYATPGCKPTGKRESGRKFGVGSESLQGMTLGQAA